MSDLHDKFWLFGSSRRDYGDLQVNPRRRVDMPKFHVVSARALLAAVCSILFLSTPLLAQRTDRAVIGGVVTDAQGAAVPGATVTIKNDVTLKVGAVTEMVDVVAQESGLGVTRPDITQRVEEKYYRDLPIITAADVRLAESVLLMQPGYLPMSPNGDPMFRGSQFASRINGGQTRATENFFDGGAFGYASGHQQSQESAPPVEAIQEVSVVTTSYSAEYGHTSGGIIEYTSKSGSNTLHGSASGYFARA